MEEIIELTSSNICEILGVTKQALKNIENRKQLKDRLKDKGYEFISKDKIGRSNFYKVKKINNYALVYSSICENLFGTRLYEEFSEYFLYRMLNTNEPLTKEYLSELSNVSRKTIGKWDDKMVENNMLIKDGKWYVAVDYTEENGKKISTYRITDKYEYESYLKNSKIAKSKANAKLKYIRGDINLDEYTLIIEGIARAESFLSEKFVYSISKFKIPTKKKLIDDIYDLIYDLRGGIDDDKYIIRFKDIK